MTLPPDDCQDCFRGITGEDKIFGASTDISVFAPDRDNPVRENWLGASVNWNLSDGGALDEIKNRRKRNGEPQFKGGAVQLPRNGMDSIIKRYGVESFSYELVEENGNIYHGHLLFSSSLIKERRAAIYGALSYIASATHKWE